MRLSLSTVPLLLLCSLAPAAEPIAFRSHPPQRPLPVASDRPLAAGPSYFVEPAKGDDRADGSQARPWKTLGHAVRLLKPGDTLHLRGGVYREHVTLTASGTAEKPITIRSFPNELAILDGGLREFFDSPATAWEPCPDGVAGEFRSTKTYADLGGPEDGVNVLGRFGDSLLPLHGYRFLPDLRSANEFWNIENKVGKDEKGIYCGPGLYHDAKTGRIHVRLAPTTLKGLHDDNYRGESDPRKLPLIVALGKDRSPLRLRGCRHVRLQDLVVRGSLGATLDIDTAAHVVIDGLTVYGGSPAVRVRDTVGLRVWNTACRGIAAPWTFRGHLKYRSMEARIFSASGWGPTGADSRDFELAYSEFTDCVDGVFLGNVSKVRFHHNLLDNVSDDGLFLTAATAYDGSTPGGDVHVYQNLLSRNLTTFAFGVGHGRQKTIAGGRQTGSGVSIYRNVFDFRRPVMYQLPTGPDAPQELASYGRVASDHGGPTWEPMFVYHNTVVSRDAPFRAYYGAGLGGHMGAGTKRRVFNNLFMQVEGLPGNVFAPPTVDLQADGNLHWGMTAGPGFTGDLLAKFKQSKAFEESKAKYAPGWAAGDRFADPRFTRFTADWKERFDLRLLEGSPAADMGVSVPADWPDPLRTADKGKPDAGALPLGAAPCRIGVRGRLTQFGEPVAGAAPAFEPAPLAAAPPPLRQRPAVVVEGYPAFDAPILEFTLRQRGVPIESHDRTRGWLDTKEYEKYGLVVLVGSLTRAKVEPSRYGKEDFERLKKYLEQGGTLLLTRSGLEAFQTPAGREFLAGLTGAGAVEKDAAMQLRLPEHPWVKHLNAKEEHAWLGPKQTVPLRVGKGDAIIGSATGSQAALYRVAVGKGQLVYVGWEIANSLPNGRKPSTVEQERVFEEQVRILRNIVAALYPDPAP